MGLHVQVYATIAGEPVVFHLTSTESLQQVAYATGITRNAAALIIAIVMLPLAQVEGAAARRLRSLPPLLWAHMIALGTACMPWAELQHTGSLHAYRPPCFAAADSDSDYGLTDPDTLLMHRSCATWRM